MAQDKGTPCQVLSLFTNTCEFCGFPIKPGPEFEDESSVHAHRHCLRQSIHNEAVASECHDLWLEAYAMLCSGLPDPETDVIPLAQEYADRLDPKGYQDFLTHAVLLVEGRVLPYESKQDMVRILTEYRDRIAELAQTKTPLHL